MPGLFESPRSEPVQIWSRIPPHLQKRFEEFALTQPIGPTLPKIPLLPEETLSRWHKVLRGDFDPTSSPAIQAQINEMTKRVYGSLFTPAMQRLAMAGQGPGSPMAEATARVGEVLASNIGALTTEALAREQALAMQGIQTQLQAVQQQAVLELQQYGMVSGETLARMNMLAGLLSGFVAPAQFGPPPILGLLGAISPFIRFR